MTDGGAVGGRVTWSQRSPICPMYLRLPQMYAFVHRDIKSRNINEGEEACKSGQIVSIHGKKGSRIIHGDTKKITNAWVIVTCISVK